MERRSTETTGQSPLSQSRKMSNRLLYVCTHAASYPPYNPCWSIFSCEYLPLTHIDIHHGAGSGDCHAIRLVYPPDPPIPVLHQSPPLYPGWTGDSRRLTGGRRQFQGVNPPPRPRSGATGRTTQTRHHPSPLRVDR